jgi:Fe-S cluster biogenesis protein NfuA
MPVEDSNYTFSSPDTTSKIQVRISGNIASCLIKPITLKMEVRLQFHATSASVPIKKKNTLSFD